MASRNYPLTVTRRFKSLWRSAHVDVERRQTDPRSTANFDRAKRAVIAVVERDLSQKTLSYSLVNYEPTGPSYREPHLPPKHTALHRMGLRP